VHPNRAPAFNPPHKAESIVQHFVQKKKEFRPAVTFSAMRLKMP
jgi:hypothetical protein